MKKLSLFLSQVKKHKVIFLVLTLAIIGLVIFIQTRINPRAPQIVEVKRQDIKSVVSASGTLSGVATVNLHFLSGGTLFSVNVKVSDKVGKDQVIASLDATKEIAALNQAQNNLREKEATLRKIYDDIHLFQYGMGGFSNIGSANETETQRAQRIAAEVAKDNAFDEVKRAQKALADTSLISPVTGKILKVDFVAGQNVSSADNIALLADTQRFIFAAEVEESDSVKVAHGQKAEVILDAYPDLVLTGTVTEIIPVTKTTSNGATVVVIKITLDNPRIDFISGLNGQVSIIQTEVHNSLTIPLEALREDHMVVLQDGDKLTEVKVEVGIQSELDVEIKEGLNEGDKILLNPPTQLSTLSRNRWLP